MAGSGALRVGLDLIEIERIRSALERPRFRERCFTATERHYCDSRPNPAESYAGRFAAKEAVGKALGCGVNFTWKEIEIAGRPRPSVSLSGTTEAWAKRMGVESIDLSLTHSRVTAAAVAILTLEEEDER
jgi:holo-[acyl-carrier protein] synthase